MNRYIMMVQVGESEIKEVYTAEKAPRAHRMAKEKHGDLYRGSVIVSAEPSPIGGYQPTNCRVDPPEPPTTGSNAIKNGTVKIP